MSKIKDLATLIAILGLPIGGTWAAVAQLWKSTAVVAPVNIHFLLVVGASLATILTLSLWWLWKQHAELSHLRVLLSETQKRPHRFQDDCTVDEATGMYLHKTKTGFFCMPCAVESDRESPMKTEKDGWGWSCSVESEHFVRGPNWKYSELKVQRRPWRL